MDRYKVIADWQHIHLQKDTTDFQGYLDGLQAIADDHRDKDVYVYAKAKMLKELAIKERNKFIHE